MTNTISRTFTRDPEGETKRMWRFIEEGVEARVPMRQYVMKDDMRERFGGVPDRIRIEIYALDVADG
jgi:hypothetical protein